MATDKDSKAFVTSFLLDLSLEKAVRDAALRDLTASAGGVRGGGCSGGFGH